MKNKKSHVIITFNISKKVYEALEATPKTYIKSRSALVNKLLSNWIEDNVPSYFFETETEIVNFSKDDIDVLTIRNQRDYEEILKKEA